MNTEQQAYRVAYLIAGYLKGELTQAENLELDDWVTASLDNQRLFEDLTDPNQLDALKKWKAGLPTEQVLQRLRSQVDFTDEKPAVKTFSWWPYVAAAAVVIIVAGFIFLYRNQTHTTRIEKTVETAGNIDLPAGANRAMLLLNDGRKIGLDSVPAGYSIPGLEQFARQEAEGQLLYASPGRDASDEPVYNTLVTPRGGQYQVRLSDGTRVWLNAASSLKYPLVFTGSSRNVELTGEAYFEVAKDAAHPFCVSSGTLAVKVLGTHFNVHAYPGEPISAVTLAEGSVDVNHTILKPGQQVRINETRHRSEVLTIDMGVVLAWTKGQFLFREATLEEILPQLSRWYDAEIVYKNNIPYHFNADIPRSVPVSKLLALLEGTGVVHFKIEDHKIIVGPADAK